MRTRRREAGARGGGQGVGADVSESTASESTGPPAGSEQQRRQYLCCEVLYHPCLSCGDRLQRRGTHTRVLLSCMWVFGQCEQM